MPGLDREFAEALKRFFPGRFDRDRGPDPDDIDKWVRRFFDEDLFEIPPGDDLEELIKRFSFPGLKRGIRLPETHLFFKDGRTVRVSREADGRVEVVVRREGEEERRFEAADLEEFIRKHPSVYEEHVKGIFREEERPFGPGRGLARQWREEIEERIREFGEPDRDRIRREIDEALGKLGKNPGAGVDDVRKGAPFESRVSLNVNGERIDVVRRAGGRISVRIRSRDENGNDIDKTYEAPSEKEFRERYPEVFSKYAEGNSVKGGMRFSFGDRGTQGDLGVSFEKVSPAIRSHLGIEGEGGFVVAEIRPSSPASAAGLEKYDLILKAGGNKVASPPDVMKALEGRDSIELEIIRRGERITLTLSR